jgi:hypothetical protein
MYVLTEEANLISLADLNRLVNGLKVATKVNFVKDLGIGRPPGGLGLPRYCTPTMLTLDQFPVRPSSLTHLILRLTGY